MLRCVCYVVKCSLTLTSLGFQYINSIILGNSCEHKLDLQNNLGCTKAQ